MQWKEGGKGGGRGTAWAATTKLPEKCPHV